MKLKEKHKFYLFDDEAHSIGIVGPNGCGVADYYNIDPKSVDLLMGTFTKSFGAGGYVAGKKAIIDRICVKGYSGLYAEPMSIPVLTQVIASVASIMGYNLDEQFQLDPPQQRFEWTTFLPGWMSLPPELASGEGGRTRLCRLGFNSCCLRGLDKLGFVTYSHPS
ncbi:serine palmitoyltransferase component [Marasmius sp. AFHP31]|nr:serine palmitoyltransferase component [Marasmius sp. AFHP31]